MPAELFQILKDNAVKALHSICQQIWKIQKKPKGWKGSIFISVPEKMKVKVTQLCLTLCHPMDYTVHEILQARILEWVAFPFSRGSTQPRDQDQVSHIAGRLFTS